MATRTSRFSNKRHVRVAPTQLMVQKHYDLSGALDTYTSNETLEPRFSPYLRNVRNTSRNTIKTRNGAGFYSIPLGETLSVSQTSTAGATDQTIGTTLYKAVKVTAGSNGRASLAQLKVKNTTPTATGPILVELRNDVLGSPGSTILASSSISQSNITTTSQYLDIRFIEAPQVASGTDYWLLAYIQDNGTNNYLLRSTNGNLISNFDFETNTVGWTAYNGGVISQSNTQAHAGTYSLSVVCSGGAGRGTSFDGTVVSANIQYTFNAYVYAPVGVTVELAVDFYNGVTYLSGDYGTMVAGNGAWQLITRTFTTPATTNLLNFTLKTSSATTFYVDDVLLRPTSYTGLAKTSNDAGATWTAGGYDLNYKLYIATDSAPAGLTRFYRSTPSATTILAHGTSHYAINDTTGVTTAFKTGLGSSQNYYYAFAQDNMYYVNGVDTPRQYNLTSDIAVAGSPEVSTLVAHHKNRLFFVSAADPTKIIFSEEGAYTTYLSTNFLYVPAPKSTDPITAIVSFQDNLYIFTRRKKWVLFGNQLANFILREAAGKQGATTQNAVTVYGNYVYFCNDTGVYRFNGSSDDPLHKRVIDDYNAIPDKTKLYTQVWMDRLYIFNPSIGSSVNNQALVLDLLFNGWYFDTNQYLGRSVLLSGPGDTSNRLLVASSVVGAVYYAENQTSDLGKAITFEYRTKYESFGDPSRQKRAKRFYPQFKTPTTGFVMTISFDKDFANSPTVVQESVASSGAIWGSGAVWGQFLWGSPGIIKPRLSVPGKFNYVQYRFFRTGVDNSIELLGWETYWVPSRAR